MSANGICRISVAEGWHAGPRTDPIDDPAKSLDEVIKRYLDYLDNVANARKEGK